jgi:hypothetical protein
VRFLASKNELSSRLDSMPWRRRHCVVERVVEIAGHVNVIHPRQLSHFLPALGRNSTGAAPGQDEVATERVNIITIYFHGARPACRPQHT